MGIFGLSSRPPPGAGPSPRDEFGIAAHAAVELRAVGQQGGEGIEQLGLGVAIGVPLAGESGPPGAKMARVMTSLAQRDACGPGLLFGRWEWQKSSTMT